jgi:ubiquinone/menaquinone biosynthesis C-methylase UbiE
MQISRADDLPITSDYELIRDRLPVEGARLLELGCGTATTTRQLAESLPVREIVAMEVDAIQHEKNLLIDDLPKVRFVFGAAQAIALPDCAVDAVIMLKSLHHVPIADMDEALDEIARVLRPGGLAYLSEPVYAGEFNEILRLFNDERWVREAAFAAVCRAVERAVLTLQEEIHFLSVSRFAGFADFQQRVLGATHSTFSIDDALFDRVRQRFQAHVGSDGHAEFLNPMRVDLLRKPG